MRGDVDLTEDAVPSDQVKHILVWAVLLSAGLLSLLPMSASAEHPFLSRYKAPEPAYKVRLEKSRMAQMRDGVLLSTDLYLPEGAQGPLPVIMIRTPYDKSYFRAPVEEGRAPLRSGPVDRDKSGYHWQAQFFAGHGYAVIVQDHRGRFESQGEFFRYQGQDGEDGYDTIEWIKEQPWSNGKVGTIGCSYLGETQHMLARQRHPNHLTAIAESGGSSEGGGGIWNFGFSRYGALELAAALSWNYRRAGHFGYGPPPHVDLEEWYAGPYARLYQNQPVMTSWDDLAAEGRVANALETLPVVDAMWALGEGAVPSGFEDWLEHNADPKSAYWDRQGVITKADKFDTPTLHVSGWYDGTPISTLVLFERFRLNAQSARARDHQYLMMTPTSHCGHPYATQKTKVGDRLVGDAFVDFPAVYLAWFNYWLKGEQNGVVGMPKASSFAMGANKWRVADTWPLPGVEKTKWYLSSGGEANSRADDGRLSLVPPKAAGADSYTYDPKAPTPSHGGSICCTGGKYKEGAVDQRPNEKRDDVVVYTSDVLEEGLEVAGALEAVLHVSSSAKDTDFVAKLIDVHPDGTAYILQEGLMRARWREGFSKPVFMKEGEIYEVRVDIEATHNYFAPGHRIRLHISSSSFPRWDRNLNTGGDNYNESEPVVAVNTIHHTPRHASHVLLSVVSADD